MLVSFITPTLKNQHAYTTHLARHATHESAALRMRSDDADIAHRQGVTTKTSPGAALTHAISRRQAKPKPNSSRESKHKAYLPNHRSARALSLASRIPKETQPAPLTKRGPVSRLKRKGTCVPGYSPWGRRSRFSLRFTSGAKHWFSRIVAPFTHPPRRR